MRIPFRELRFIVYLAFLGVISWFLFNFLLNSQSVIMYKYFIEKPTTYNLERAERLASSIYQSFKQEVSDPDINNIEAFIKKYNEIPFLSVNFVYQDESGIMHSVVSDVKEIDILSAEYVYPIRHGDRDIGTLIVYDINKEYKKGMAEYQQMMGLTKTFFALLLFLLLSVLVFREYGAAVEKKKRLAEFQAIHDGLTGLFNHKYFKNFLLKEIQRAHRYKRPISLIMCDVDHFKKFNDSYGHLMGDMVLQTVAKIIGENVRSFDIVARYGGEEFAVLLVEAGHEQAKNIAKRLKNITDQAVEIAGRIREKVASAEIEFGQIKTHVTMSMGVASYNGEDDYKSEYLISQADHALYESKKNGRNQITVYDPADSSFKPVSE